MNSRYYSPTLRRLLNLDNVAGSNQDIMAYNTHACCSNNPISKIDMDGQSSAYYLAIQKELVKMVNRVYKKSTMQNFEYFDMPENPEDRVCPVVPSKKQKENSKNNKKNTKKNKRKEVTNIGVSAQIEVDAGVIKAGGGGGYVLEIEYTDTGMNCYVVEYWSLSLVIAGSKKYYETQVDCSNYNKKIGPREYKEEHFFLWYIWDKDGRVRKEIEIGVDIPGAALGYTYSLE